MNFNTDQSNKASQTQQTACQKPPFDYPQAPFPPQNLYEILGEDKIRNIIRTQHELIWKSDIQFLFGENPKRFNQTVTHTENYFIEMFGGPKGFTSSRGEPKLGKRHQPLQISLNHRKIWLDCLRQALLEHQTPYSTAQIIWDWVEPLSIRFLNPKLPLTAIERYSLDPQQKAWISEAKDYD